LPYNVSDSDIDSLRKAGIDPILQTPGGRVLTPDEEGESQSLEIAVASKERQIAENHKA
jgi:hypothetical protein